MHRGVADLLRWVDAHPDFPGFRVNPPATMADIAALEQQLGMPLPADLRLVLSRFNGGTLPSGTMLIAGTGPTTIEDAVRRFAERVGADFLDPELLLPFLRTNEGSLLAFDRSAGPVSDTWPIVDYYEDTGDTRLVYRTFDGWCRTSVAEWSAPDFLAEFSLDKYLASGVRHAQIEADVSSSHATVAHALRRAGRPADALESYLRAARCVPALGWCDWEALKVATILGRDAEALEAAKRVSARGPEARWAARETTPGRVADVVGILAMRAPDLAPWLQLLDTLVEEARDPDDRAHAHAVRKAVLSSEPLPAPLFARETPVVAPARDLDAWWQAAVDAYTSGTLRDDDILFDRTLGPLGKVRRLGALLEIRREF
jgi:hypothetical protein